jgi:hypothetical protein
MTRTPLGLGRIVSMLGSRSRPETAWVSDVVGCSLDQAEHVVEEITSQGRTVEAMSERIQRTGREYYAQFPAPIELFAFVRLLRPSKLVESGVSSGVSSTFLLLGARVNGGGTLHSIDFPIVRGEGHGNPLWVIPEGHTSGWAIPRSLRSRWDLLQGRSEDLLKPLLSKLGAVDLYCHDSPVDIEHFEFEMKAVSSHLQPGSLVVADNTDWKVFEETARSLGAVAIHRRKSSLGAFRVPNKGKRRINN